MLLLLLAADGRGVALHLAAVAGVVAAKMEEDVLHLPTSLQKIFRSSSEST